MTEDKKPFSVTDKRKFTPEGEARPGADAEEGSPEGPQRAGAAAPDPPPRHEPGERASQFPKDLIGLLVSLGAQASLLLLGSPEVGPPDLEGARNLITLLETLKEKTEGRRTPPEDQLIEGLLYELRMGYVQRTGKASAP